RGDPARADPARRGRPCRSRDPSARLRAVGLFPSVPTEFCATPEVIMRVERIAVLGAGIMGRGIAYAAAVSGFDTTLFDVSPDALGRAEDEIRKLVEKGVEAGKVDAAAARALRLTTHRELEAAVAKADLVIEAAPEDIRLKLDLFTRLDHATRPETILATNTSSLSVTEMAAATGR